MGNITAEDLKKLQEAIKKAPESQKSEIKKVIDLYLPLINKQLKNTKKELEFH